MRGCLVTLVGLILFGWLLSWVATSWPDTLSGLFMLVLIVLAVRICLRAGIYPIRYIGWVRHDHYHHRDPNR